MAGDRRPILLLFNPSSGGKPAAPGTTERPGPEVLASTLRGAGLAVDVRQLAEDDDPAALARTAALAGRDVVAAGGDGTVRPAASALIGTDATLGIVPLGSWNNIARGCGIPQDPEAALSVIVAGDIRRLDAGLAWRPAAGTADMPAEPPTDATPFFEAAGVGLDAVGFGAAAMGERLGAWRALQHGWRALRRRHTPMRLEVDDRRVRTAAPAVTVCNGPYYGFGFAVAPKADPADGLLDVVVFSGMSQLDVVRHFLAVARGRPRREPRVRQLAARSIRIDATSPQPVHADGEPLGVTPVSLAIRPGALRIFAPPPA